MNEMKKNIGLLFLCACSFLFLYCSNRGGNKDVNSTNTQIKENKQEITIVDIDTKLRNLEIPSEGVIKSLGDSLFEADGDRIIGDISFQMTKKEYNRAYNDLMKEYDGRLYIICSKIDSDPNYFFYIDSIKPSFHEGKLWSILFYGIMDDNSMSNSIIKQIRFSFDALKEKFLNKYGNPHFITYNTDFPGTNAVYPITSVNWKFEHRSISIYPRGGGVKVGSEYILEPHPNYFRIYDTKTQIIVDEESKIHIEKMKESIGKELQKIEKGKERKRILQKSL